MSNVYTFRDLEKGRSTEPFPDPWKQYPQRSSRSSMPPSGLSMQKRFQLTYIGIDGNPAQLNTDQPIGIGQLCCMNCCPCFVSPYCDDEKKKQYLNLTKSFTFVVSFIQVVLLIVALALGGFAEPSDNPSLGPTSESLLLLGAKYNPPMKEGQVWRFVVPIFLHAGFIHIFFNLYAQLRFGLSLERKWGVLKFALLYFISGIGGNLLSCFISPNGVGVGASGAIMGLMGGYLGEVLMTWDRTDPNLRKLNLIQIVVVVAITLAISFSPYVDMGAHLGGFIVGLLIGLIYFAKESKSIFVSRYLNWIALVILVIYLVLGFALFYTVA